MAVTFHEVYEAHATAVYRFATRLTGDASLAEDLTAEAFVRLWTSPGEIRQPTVRAYLFTIVRNLYTSTLRRSRRSAPLDESLPDPSDPVSVPLERRSEALATMKAVRSLSAIDRAALLMRTADVPYVDMAKSLGISVSAAKLRVHRARLRLLRACGWR
jgi:RNA polymerase sigma-70 factor (ECF subfamily)